MPRHPKLEVGGARGSLEPQPGPQTAVRVTVLIFHLANLFLCKIEDSMWYPFSRKQCVRIDFTGLCSTP